MAQWRDADLDIPCVSVNLSPINFQNANLAASVAEILAEHGLPPEMLMLEVTESVFLNERSGAIETMSAVRKLGVGLSLDDFGTGYSSLSRLAHLPIRELKIDRSFMRDVESDPTARAIVTTVLRVGQSLLLTVVAEGVETEVQRNLLTELGCHVVQGFLYAPALSPPPPSAVGCLTTARTGRASCCEISAGPCRPGRRPARLLVSCRTSRW
jgi:EAL domain-containing protein (putative c-di-GMP-specific phosphodiesterase class I)